MNLAEKATARMDAVRSRAASMSATEAETAWQQFTSRQAGRDSLNSNDGRRGRGRLYPDMWGDLDEMAGAVKLGHMSLD